MILLIDNYDSFVFNLARYFQRLGQNTRVVRNDETAVPAIQQLKPAAIVLSPGPCGPEQTGCSLEVVRRLHAHVPILGVCLGHQTIAAALGGRIVPSPQPMHGRSSEVTHNGEGVFAGLANPLRCGRYHSLAVEEQSLPDCLRVTARTAEGVVMALAHRGLPVVGVQFHPESILTESGYALLANFLRLAGVEVSGVPAMSSEQADLDAAPWRQPQTPVTF